MKKRAAAGLLVLLAGCAGEQPVGPADGGRLEDARTISNRPDAQSDAGLRRCFSDLDCPADSVCLGGFCQPDPCSSASPCEGETRCRAICVDLVDPCLGVTCAADETCVEGECFAGCLPVVCEGVLCPEGEFCDRSTGGCRSIDPCEATCGDAEACHFTCTPRTPCEGVSCDESEFCRAGECLPNPCFDVECPRGAVCQNGECVETCGCDPACEPPLRCIANRCVCVPRCAPTGECGVDDGCGGFCVGTCGADNEACNPDTGLCECIPSCAEDAACGDDDGCGGFCDGPCEGPGETCVEGACACLDVCLDASEVPCGADVPETCMGGRDCPGTGTRCGNNGTCDDGRCCGLCDSPADVPCGERAPNRFSGGERCRVCRDIIGTACTGGDQCVPRPEDRRLTCCDSCPSASGIACGEAIPDVLDESGEVCRVCEGFGTGGCDGGSCEGSGDAAMCCDACAPRRDVACGEPVPDLDCRSCDGFGRDCPDGESCRNPPGTSGADAQVCCGQCARRADVACGEPIPDVLGPDGGVCRNCSTGTSCPSGESCVDGSCCPLCPGDSTVACGEDIPDQLDATGAVCRMCGTGRACGAGERCTGGLCCPTCEASGALACGVDPAEPPGCPSCPDGTACPAGSRCTDGACCAPSCAPPESRACGSTASDGCGGACAEGTFCPDERRECIDGRCRCRRACEGRACGESDGCGAECRGSCDPGFVCAEQPDTRRDYECEPSACIPSCGICEACVAGECLPLECAPGEDPCLSTCECCPAGSACTPTGCSDFG